MRLTPIGVLGVLAFVPASWALDEPPGAPSAKAGSPQARLEAILREHAQAQRASFAAYRKATTDDERKKAGCVEARREEICRPHDGAGRVGPRRPRGR